MASITVRNLDEDLKERLREQAAKHGCSMEEEVRRILAAALPPKVKINPAKGQQTPKTGLDLATGIHNMFRSSGLTEEDIEVFINNVEELRHPERSSRRQADDSESSQ
ncbi:MAG: plasmid stabilization protein [Chloroflexota bacterium]|nr:plasmid stabilization protein [Chloroflexota bacterium]